MKTVTRSRPVPMSGWLIAGAVLAIAAGQLWTIAWQFIRFGPRPLWGSWQERRRLTPPLSGSFGPIPRWVTAVFLATVATAIVTAWTTSLSTDTASPTSGCHHRISINKTHFECVSPTQYARVAANQQRSASSVILAFAALHVASTLGAVATQRSARLAPAGLRGDE